MSIMRKRYSVPIAIAIALVIAPSLAGCFGGNPIQQLVQGATGGNVNLGGKSVPDGYPKTEVPLIQGDIISGISLGNKTDGLIFNVVVKVSSLDAANSIKGQLEGAGLTGQLNGATSTEGTTLVYTSDKWGVLVLVIADKDNGFVANYTVTAVSKTN